jgi:Pyruvate/2-oxoglutarate dehydrogenase complex, dehydrogenase (E1) component, eukaryotic type, alpha subunit
MDKNGLFEMYRKMLKIRYFEQRAVELYTQGVIQGTIHPYLGEEAMAAGVCHALRKDDYITSTHRGHGHCVAKGGDLDKMMAELLGKSTGYCQGRGGSMHIADVNVGILGANGIVAAGAPIAVGAGLTIQTKGTDQVVACFSETVQLRRELYTKQSILPAHGNCR